MGTLAFKCPIQRNRLFSSKVNERRLESVNYAISLQGCTTNGEFIYHDLWESPDGEFKVSLGKYGKEFYLNTLNYADGHKGNNPNDMKPSLFVDGKRNDEFASFDSIFAFFEYVNKNGNDRALELLGSIVFRNAYLEDHVVSKDSYMYNPPMDAIKEIESIMDNYNGISIEAFIHYLDAIGYNEEVKYYGLGYNFKGGIGRKNNMLTYANIIAVLMGKASFYKLCGSFSRPPIGVSPITIQNAMEAFPELEIK